MQSFGMTKSVGQMANVIHYKIVKNEMPEK